MSASGMSIVIKKMIRKYGQDLKHKKLVEVDIGNGQIEKEYQIQEPVRGQVTELTPLDNFIEYYGVRVEADYIVTFLPDADVAKGDLLEIEDGWAEVQNIFRRRTRGLVDYQEALLRRKQ